MVANGGSRACCSRRLSPSCQSPGEIQPRTHPGALGSASGTPQPPSPHSLHVSAEQPVRTQLSGRRQGHHGALSDIPETLAPLRAAQGAGSAQLHAAASPGAKGLCLFWKAASLLLENASVAVKCFYIFSAPALVPFLSLPFFSPSRGNSGQGNEPSNQGVGAKSISLIS